MQTRGILGQKWYFLCSQTAWWHLFGCLGTQYQSRVSVCSREINPAGVLRYLMHWIRDACNRQTGASDMKCWWPCVRDMHMVHRYIACIRGANRSESYQADVKSVSLLSFREICINVSLDAFCTVKPKVDSKLLFNHLENRHGLQSWFSYPTKQSEALPLIHRSLSTLNHSFTYLTWIF